MGRLNGNLNNVMVLFMGDRSRTQGSTFEMIVTKDSVGDFEAIFETLEILPAPVGV